MQRGELFSTSLSSGASLCLVAIPEHVSRVWSTRNALSEADDVPNEPVFLPWFPANASSSCTSRPRVEFEELHVIRLRAEGCQRRLKIDHLAPVGQTNYAAAKAGVVRLTKALALEVGPLAINVNAIAPVARTAMTRRVDLALHLPEGPERGKVLAARLARSALRWIGEAEAVIPAFLFLASQASNYITGQILNVDGANI